jgi:hypothetical protein
MDTIGVKLALKWIEPSWSREIEETLADPEVARSRSDFVDSLDRLVELIYQQGRTPVVVIDDSDRFLRKKSSARAEVLEPFFRETCRMLAERNWGIVLAVNPEYCTSASFRLALTEGFVNNQFDVPRLPEPCSLHALINARITRRAQESQTDAEFRASGDADSFADASASDVFEDGFEEILFERYTRAEGNLRAVLTVADQALRETIALSESRITNTALQQTILALLP